MICQKTRFRIALRITEEHPKKRRLLKLVFTLPYLNINLGTDIAKFKAKQIAFFI